MPRSLQILRQRTSLISLWRGTADLAPVAGLPHHECLAPSRISWQPLSRRCARRARRFKSRL